MNKVYKRLISIILAILTIFTFFCFSGCVEKNKSYSVIDQAGRKVEINGVPNRIVSGYYVSTSVCVALELTEKLVGIETGRDNRPIYSLINNETVNKALDVGSAKNFDLEKCCQANPDLVILPYKAKNSAGVLEELGVCTIVVNPETQEDFIEMIRLVAKITGTEKKSKQLIDYINSKTTFIKEVIKDIPSNAKPKVFMGSASGYLTTSPKNMYQSSIIKLAGGKNCGDIYNGNNKVEVDKEQFINMNPDVIIIPTNSNANGYAYNKNTYTTDSIIASVNAIKNGNIYYMPKGFESWDSPTPSSILGALYILHVLYPDLYSEDEFKDEVYYFYDTFYNVKIDKNTILL